jgi:4-hydroxy-tetrahydrodipicolinate reductase
MQKIRIGIFGFDKTGRVVVNKFIQDKAFDVRWIVRRSSSNSR